MDAAKTGAGEFEITREVYEAAPKSRTGEPIDILVVGCYLADQLGYTVTLQDGAYLSSKTLYRLELDDPNEPQLDEVLPVSVSSWTQGRKKGVDACRSAYINNIAKIRQGKSLAATLPEGTAFGQSSSQERKETLSELEECFIVAVDAACSSAQKAVYELARQAFSQGLSEFVVDEQVWTDVAAKFQLAGEKWPPLFRRDVKALVAGDGAKKEIVSELLPSVAQLLAFKTDGLCVTPTLPANFNPNDDIDRFLKIAGALDPRLPLRLRPKFGQDATDGLNATRDNV